MLGLGKNKIPTHSNGKWRTGIELQQIICSFVHSKNNSEKKMRKKDIRMFSNIRSPSLKIGPVQSGSGQIRLFAAESTYENRRLE